ncbi:hypothetical protein KY348_01110 [Candidatus Woesearchaeota archaeon]|nr:hypothetical protein [Candidatus Woesearchaeota archaeon]
MKIPIIESLSTGNRFQDKVKQAKQVLGEDDFYYVKTRTKAEAERIILEEKNKGNKCYGIFSGDGGIRFIINHYLPQEVVLLIDPKGLSNNLANSLKKECIEHYYNLSRNHDEKKVNLADYVIKTDAMEVKLGDNQPEFAASTIGVGLTAAICYDVENHRKRGSLRKKIHYGAKTIGKKIGFEPMKISYSVNKGEQQGTLENILAIEIANGSHIASMPNFNPKDNLNSGFAGLFLLEDKGHWKWTELLFNLKFFQNTRHITLPRDARGFNKLGVNYRKIKSLDIRILDGYKDCFLEMDGEPRRFSAGDEISVIVKPRALKLVYLPWILGMISKNSRIYYEEK